MSDLGFLFDETNKPSIEVKPKADVAPAQRLFFVPNLDIHLHHGEEAVANIAGPDPELSAYWLSQVVSTTTQLKPRRFSFPARDLDRLLSFRKPANITLDAACVAVGRALWASKLGWKPLTVTSHRQRLLANSPRWPTGWKVSDAPWTAIQMLIRLNIHLDVDPRARSLMAKKLADAGEIIASAGLAGSAVSIETKRPDLIESLNIPALAYAGEPGTGKYRLPLLAAEPLLRMDGLEMGPDVRSAIKRAVAVPNNVKMPEDFPWTLFPFQARDLARAVRIVETAGGVLLAGDMGSGKTTVSLGLLAYEGLWPALVICPLAAISTWDRQLTEMGKTFYRAEEAVEVCKQRIANEKFDAVIVTYDRLHRLLEPMDGTDDNPINCLEAAGFACMVADEIQRVRTPGSRRSRALRSFAASVPVRIGLSGTPITNMVLDAAVTAAALVPADFPSRSSTKDLSDFYPGDSIESLAEHLGSIMVRRRMEDTGVKLPGRTIKRAFVNLTADQRDALEALEAEARNAKEEGEFSNARHVFARLQLMRQIVNVPEMAGIAGINPKLEAAVDIAQEFAERGEKSIIFVADRAAWTDAGKMLDKFGIGWTGIWGSTPIPERITNEHKYHNDPSCMVFIGTLAACGESLTLSPTARATVFASLSYSPSVLAQAAARAYRMNTKFPVTEIYLSAQGPNGTLDDRMWELVTAKRELFAQVVDRTKYVDAAERTSLADLVFLLTGERDERLDMRDKDSKAEFELHQARKDQARGSAHKHKKGNADFIKDDGSMTKVLKDKDDTGKNVDQSLANKLKSVISHIIGK